MLIRKYRNSDRSDVEHIHFETGFLGSSMDKLVTDRKFYSSTIKYYLEKEPESILVVEDKNKVVGYLFGCLDDKNHSEIKEIVPMLFFCVFKLPFMHRLDRKYWRGQINTVLRAMIGRSDELKLKMPKDSGHLHINFLPEYRGKGLGSRLLKKFFAYAKKNGVKTIHADSFQTNLNPNKNFWIKNGFIEYSKVKTKLWKLYYPDEEIFLVVYLKKF